MNGPEEIAATGDELATVFLRGRDVACPGCLRNRRGQTADTCPYCGESLAIRPSDTAARLLARRAIGWFASAGICAGGVGVAYYLFMVAVVLLIAGFKLDPDTVVICFYALPISMMCVVMSICFRASLRSVYKQTRLKSRHLTRARVLGFLMLMCLVGMILVDPMKVLMRSVM